MKDALRTALSQDIDLYRKKIAFYQSHNLFEAVHYVGKLADNLELALTTLPKDDDSEIA